MARRPSSSVAAWSPTRNAIAVAQRRSTGAVVAERGAELAAFAQAGAGLFGVGVGDGRAHGEQGGRDQGRGADLAGQRERFAWRAGRPRARHR